MGLYIWPSKHDETRGHKSNIWKRPRGFCQSSFSNQNECWRCPYLVPRVHRWENLYFSGRDCKDNAELANHHVAESWTSFPPRTWQAGEARGRKLKPPAPLEPCTFRALSLPLVLQMPFASCSLIQEDLALSWGMLYLAQEMVIRKRGSTDSPPLSSAPQSTEKYLQRFLIP